MVYVSALLIALLSVWSYSQIDLNLTLSTAPIYQSFQSAMITLGYFNRTQNTVIISVLVNAVLGLYLYAIYATHKGLLSYSTVRKSIVCIAIISLSAYTAFSHDIFNYIFDARIVTMYGLNPYELRALDFPQDTWTRFMQWTHRTYPYGPVWLLITVIPSFIGGGKFVITFALFKIMFAGSYVASCILLGRIADNLKINKPLVVVLFALHPLVLFDMLISPRIDSVMISVALFGIYAILQNKRLFSVSAILCSAAIKFATGALIPLAIKPQWWTNSKRILYISLVGIVSTIAQSVYSRELQPWYLLVPVSFFPLLVGTTRIRNIVIIQLIATIPMWVYIYFVYTGVWHRVI